MPSSMLKGKTKSDLIEIAHLSGLLTKTQTNRMTKAQILEVLQKAEEESSGPAKELPETEAAAKPAEKTAEDKLPDLSELPMKDIDTETQRIDGKEAAAAEPLPDSSELPDVKKNSKAATEKENVKAPTTDSKETAVEESPKPQKKSRRKSAAKSSPDNSKKTTKSTSKNPSEISPDSEHESGKAKSKSSAKTKKTKATDKKVIELNGNQSKQEKSGKDNESDKENVNAKDIEKDSDRENLSDNESNQDNENPKKDHKTKEKVKEELEVVSGILEIMPDNYGFLRVENFLQSNRDIYIAPQFIRRFNLRNGDKVEGTAKVQRDNDRYRALTYVNTINDLPFDKIIRRPHFDRLTPIYPNERYKLETHPKELATRMIDLISPIGKGQRGMIVSPPKAGKTILLQKIANAISINNPKSKLFVLLIDERPEEVTDMQRSIDGEVVYSTFDKTPENHVKVTELVLERAMRLVELGEDVVILLDSITRMSRAYNLTINPTGRTLSGGLDPGALHGPKRFFGAARNIENGGSLTIIATALVETGSRMDEVIFEEFKGTGNMEVVLDRKLAEKRVFPAIDLNRSSTRREDLLMTKEELNTVWAMRKAFANSETLTVTETMINLLLKTRSNEQFTKSISVSLKDQDLFEAMQGSMPQNFNNGNNANGSSGGANVHNRTNY